MKNSKTIISTLVLAMVVFSIFAIVPAQALVDTTAPYDLSASGSSTVWPISDIAASGFITKVATMGAPYNQITTLTHASIGSGNGIANWQNHLIDMAASSEAPVASPGAGNDVFSATYPYKGISDPQAFALGRDSVAVIVPSTNTWISNIDCQTVDAIYTGTITNWNQIGGPNQVITVIGRDTSSGTFDGFNNFFLKQFGHSKNNLVTGYIPYTTNQQVLGAITGGSNPYAIAFIGMGFVDNVPTGVKPLNLYNPTTGTYVSPTIAHVIDRTYVSSGGSYTTPKVIARWLWYFMDGIPTAGTSDSVKSLWISYVKSDPTFVGDNGYIVMNRADMAGTASGNPNTSIGTQTVPDGGVTYNDITYFVSAYILYNGASNKINPYADFNADATVGYSDITSFVSSYIAYNS